MGLCRFENHGVRLIPYPSFLSKNQKLVFVPGAIFIPELKSVLSVVEDKFWCPVRALKCYLQRTEGLWKSQTLYLTLRTLLPDIQGHHSRWLVDLIPPCLQGKPRAHNLCSLQRSFHRQHPQGGYLENPEDFCKVLPDRCTCT